MNKQEFLKKLKKKLSVLPRKEREERISFYREMIDDGIEEGFTEEEAVVKVGDINDVASRIITDFLSAKEAEKNTLIKRKRSPWEIVLLALGFPLWGSLLIAAFAVAVSLYAVVCSLVIALWAVFAAFVVCAPFGILMGIIALFENGYLGFALIGGGILCAGVSIFLFFASISAMKGVLKVLKKSMTGKKNYLYKKGAI